MSDDYQPPAIHREGTIHELTAASGSGPDYDGTFIFAASGEPLVR
jgi:hypothetical protein